MRRSACVLIGLTVVGAAALATPRLVVDRAVYDFGTVMDGVVIEFPVTLTNAGNSTLTITNVTYNCACTSYELPKRVLGPGESVVMKVTFNTRGYSSYPQPVSQVLTVHSNDPTKPQQVIEVRGHVRVLGAHEGAASTLDAEFYVLVDLRPAEAYARGHLLGALNIPFPELTARMNELPKSKVVYLYDETGIHAVQAAQILQRHGFLLGRAISGGLARWWQLYGDLFFAWAPGAVRAAPTAAPYYGTFAVVDPSRVAQRYLYIVDIRSPEAFARGRFPGAVNVQLRTQEEIARWATSLPRPSADATLAVWIVDENGSVACSIAQYLQSLGFTRARCLFGGIAAWRASYGDTLLFPAR